MLAPPPNDEESKTLFQAKEHWARRRDGARCVGGCVSGGGRCSAARSGKPLREVPSWEMILFRLSGENQMGVSAKVAARISTQLKKYQRVLEAARQRDIGEADTVTIITDLHLHPARA